MRVSFNDILEQHKGKTTIGYYTYPVTNETTPYQYWLKIKSNVINKFIDNLYENHAPLLISVKVFNVEKYKNSVIEETYDKNTRKSIFKITPKFNSIQKRGIHTTPIYSQEIKRNLITPIKINETDKLKPFLTLDIETINFNGVEYPIAISLRTDVETFFFTINKSLLKYDVGILDAQSLEAEILKMWRRLHRKLSELAYILKELNEIDETLAKIKKYKQTVAGKNNPV
jgi:hypothetical protein